MVNNNFFYQRKNQQLNKGAFLFRFYGFGFREPAIKAQYKEQCIHLADALAYKGKIQNKWLIINNAAIQNVDMWDEKSWFSALLV